MQSAARSALTHVLGGLVGLLVAALVALAFVQVVLRYGFGTSLLWVEEVSVMMLIWLAWIGIVHLWLTRGHIVVDLFPASLTPAGRRRLGFAIDTVALVCGVGLAVVSLETLEMFSGMDLGSLEIDSSTKYYPVTCGGVGLAVASLLNLWRGLNGREPGT